MLNRSQGNTGKVVRIDDGAQRPQFGAAPPAPARSINQSAPAVRSAAPQPPGILERLTRLIPGKLGGIGELETDDIILLLILYLMYRESGDSELLIIMGAMFLL